MGGADVEHWIEAAVDAVRNGRIALPSLPTLAVRVRQAITKPNTDAAGLARIIAEDPVISARLLKVANSAAARRNESLNRLDRAVARLGFSLVSTLVTGLCMARMMERHVGAAAELLTEHHGHTIAVAATAREIARSRTRIDPEQALLAGLLHDIGNLPLLDFAQHEPALQEDTPGTRELLNRAHPEVGALVLSVWNFDEQLVTVAREHENPAYDHVALGPDLTDVIITANLEVRQGSDVFGHALERLRLPAPRRLGLAESALSASSQSLERIEETRRVLTA